MPLHTLISPEIVLSSALGCSGLLFLFQAVETECDGWYARCMLKLLPAILGSINVALTVMIVAY